MTGLIVWLLLGLIAGALAKWIMPGPDPGGWIVTIIIGIIGAMIGGFIGGALGLGGTGSLGIGSIALSVLGALILLYGYRKLA